MNIKTILTVFFLCFGLFIASAQRHHEMDEKNKERIKELKIAYITSELEFTSQEAQDFWPIYNAFEEKNHQTRQKFISIKRQLKDFDAISETQAEGFIQQFQDIENEIHQNKQNLITQLKKVLSAKKIIKLKKAEMEFKRKLMRQYRDKRKKRFSDN